MPRNKSNRFRLVVVVTMILVLAIASLVLLSSSEVTAGQSSLPSSLEVGSVGAESSAMPLSSMSAMASIVKMISALVIVVICIYGAVYFLKRLTRGKRSNDGQDDLLEVLHSAHLGPKKMVSIVRVADRSVLVGVTDNQITLLSEMDEEKTAEIVKADAQCSSSGSFGEILRSVSEKVKGLGSRKVQTVLHN